MGKTLLIRAYLVPAFDNENTAPAWRTCNFWLHVRHFWLVNQILERELFHVTVTQALELGYRIWRQIPPERHPAQPFSETSQGDKVVFVFYARRQDLLAFQRRD